MKMCRSKYGVNAARKAEMTDMDKDASVSRWDFGLDTESMEDIAGFLVEMDWLETLETNLTP